MNVARFAFRSAPGHHAGPDEFGAVLADRFATLAEAVEAARPGVVIVMGSEDNWGHEPLMLWRYIGRETGKRSETVAASSAPDAAQALDACVKAYVSRQDRPERLVLAFRGSDGAAYHEDGRRLSIAFDGRMRF